MFDDAHSDRSVIRCVFFAFRGADLLFKRSIDLTHVPRVGERIHIWFTEEPTVRGTVRDVRWTIPETGHPVVSVQVELGPGDRERFAHQTPMSDPIKGSEETPT